MSPLKVGQDACNRYLECSGRAAGLPDTPIVTLRIALRPRKKSAGPQQQSKARQLQYTGVNPIENHSREVIELPANPPFVR